MELGMIGLGRMGANMTERLLRAGHRIAVYDIDSFAVQRTAALGAIGSRSIEALVRALKPPRAIWLMVPAGEVVERTLNDLRLFLQEGDAGLCRRLLLCCTRRRNLAST
jgi:6-phosphogluconate dehydrogenase